MKKYLLSFTMLMAICSLRAQISVTYDTLQTDVSNGSTDVVLHNTLYNNSNEEKTYQWVRTVLTAPAEWTSAICDKNLCYAEFVSTKEFVMQPQEQNATLDLHLYPNGYYAGYGIYDLTVSEVNNPTNAVSAIYIYETGVSSTKEIQLANFKAYPNPTAGLFTLSGTEGKISYLSLHDLAGKQLQMFPVNEGNWYDIANLPSGTYLMNLLDDSQQPISRARLISKF